MTSRQKFYVFVDESGQDDTSKVFIVVAAVVLGDDRIPTEKLIIDLEDAAKTGRRKWNSTRHDRRAAYLSSVLDRNAAKGAVFFGVYQKPIHFFFPVVEIIEKSIKGAINGDYTARVYVDGANKKVASALTNALRSRGVSVRMARGKREESEALIRLADMWAGCIRSAYLGKPDAKMLFEKAQRERYLVDIGTGIQNPHAEA